MPKKSSKKAKVKFDGNCKGKACDIAGEKGECKPCEAAQIVNFGNMFCEEAEQKNPKRAKKLLKTTCSELFDEASMIENEDESIDIPKLKNYVDTVMKIKPLLSAESKEGLEEVKSYAVERKVYQ